MAVGAQSAIGPVGLAGVVGLVWLTAGLRALGALRAHGLTSLLRALPVAGLATLPAWAALGTGHRVAELPGLSAIVDWRAVAGMLEALELQRDLEAAVAAAAQRSPAEFPPTVARWRELVEREIDSLRGAPGLHEAVTADLVLAVIAAESGGNPAARSPAQAVGLMQVLPTTLASLAARTPVADAETVGVRGGRLDAYDPRVNVRAGILYLDEAVRYHGGDVAWALAGYNAGISASLRARAFGTPLWPESDRFVARVLAALQTGAATAAW